MIVLDTHVFIWYALGDAMLPEPIRTQIYLEAEQVFVPSVCFWEAMLLAERGRIRLGDGRPDLLLKKFLAMSGFKEAPLTAETAMLSRTLKFEHEDPADRFIAATAHALKAKLATSDSRLRNLPWVKLAY